MDYVYLVQYEGLEPCASYNDVVACYSDKEKALKMMERLVEEVKTDAEEIPHFMEGYDIYRNDEVPDDYDRTDDQVLILNKDGIYYDLYYVEKVMVLS